MFHRLFAFAHQRANRGGRGVEERDFVLVDGLPEAARVRIVGHAFEHHRRRAVGERSVDDIAVTRDPADVGGAPEHVVFAHVEDEFVRHRGVDQIAAARVQHALRLARRAGRVEDEERILRVHGSAAHSFDWRADDFFEPVDRAARTSATRTPVRRTTSTCFTHSRAGRRQREIDVRLERDALAAAQAFIGGDDDARAAVRDAPGQRIGGEAAEHDGMNRADARAREHRDRRFGNHRQIDRDAIALLHAERLQRIRALAYALVQLRDR